MRAMALALVAMLFVPATAAGRDPNAPVRVLWNSAPDDVRPGGTWDARMSVLQGPGGFDGGNTRPAIVVTELASGAERRVPMIVDVPPNTFRAAVTFPRAGFYRVAATGFDPREPARLAEFGSPVGVGAAAPEAHTGTAWWPWALAAAATLAALLTGAWRMRSVPWRRRPGTAQSGL